MSDPTGDTDAPALSPAKALNDRIEAYAREIACQRHLGSMRGCLYDAGAPCRCREAVAAAHED